MEKNLARILRRYHGKYDTRYLHFLICYIESIMIRIKTNGPSSKAEEELADRFFRLRKGK